MGERDCSFWCKKDGTGRRLVQSLLREETSPSRSPVTSQASPCSSVSPPAEWGAVIAEASPALLPLGEGGTSPPVPNRACRIISPQRRPSQGPAVCDSRGAGTALGLCFRVCKMGVKCGRLSGCWALPATSQGTPRAGRAHSGARHPAAARGRPDRLRFPTPSRESPWGAR